MPLMYLDFYVGGASELRFLGLHSMHFSPEVHVTGLLLTLWSSHLSPSPRGQKYSSLGVSFQDSLVLVHRSQCVQSLFLFCACLNK